MKRFTRLGVAASVVLIGGFALAASALADGRHHQMWPAPAPQLQVNTINNVNNNAVVVVPQVVDPYAADAAAAGCPLIYDATLRQVYRDGQRRYAWRGREFWFIGPPPNPNASRLCDHNGTIAWWTPPQPRELDPPLPIEQPDPGTVDDGLIPSTAAPPTVQ